MVAADVWVMIAREEYTANWGQPTQGLLFPLEQTNLVRPKGCRHPKRYQCQGPRVPALYGSYPTIVCTNCWGWKIEMDTKWRKDLVWEHLSRDDDDY